MRSRRRLRWQSGQAAEQSPDDVRTLVGRLDLEEYTATVKGLTE